MDSTKLTMTAQLPSGFGAPVSGYAFGVSAATASAVPGTAVPACVRDRAVARIAAIRITPAHAGGAAWGSVERIDANFPGTSAWRPPSR